MRVGLVCPYSFDVPGGVQTHVRDLAEELLRIGSPRLRARARRRRRRAAAVRRAGGPSGPGALQRLRGPAARSGRCRPTACAGGSVRATSTCMHVHEPTSPSLGVLACWAGIGPIVATFHTSTERSRALIATGGILNTALEKVSARIAVSEYARTTLVDHLGGDAVLIPNGVDLRSYRGAKRLDDLPGVDGARAGVPRADRRAPQGPAGPARGAAGDRGVRPGGAAGHRRAG